MMDPNRLCPGCMQEWGHPDQPCPACGFVVSQYERPARWLPLRFVLNGKYMIGRVLGEGGFGITYLGWDLNLQVRVAVKEYFPVSLATRDSSRDRPNAVSSLPGVRRESYQAGLEKFMTEAQTLSKFYHLPGIVSVRDFFFENDTAYMIMEYVDGVTLGAYLRERGGQIPEAEVLQLFRPVMEALKIIHHAGIVHRDISPDNIMMTRSGEIKLIDFGAARFANNETERSLTIILKHGYAPAEQYQSHGKQGPWTDVYALCATMYRMLTGKVPPSAMDRLHDDTLEDFTDLGVTVSERTTAMLLDRGLAIRVEDRCPSMDELLDGLFGTGEEPKRQKKRKTGGDSKRKRTVLIAAAAGICVVLLAGGFFLSRGGTGPANPAGSGSGTSTQAGGGTQTETASPLKNLPEISSEELRQGQEEARAEAARFSAAGNHLVLLQEDGSLATGGSNGYGELNLNRWSGVTAVSTGSSHTLGLLSDGTVRAAGDESDGKCAVDVWKSVTQVSAGNSHSLALRSDGTVAASGSNSYGQCSVSDWSDITQVAAGSFFSLGLKSDGTVVSAGSSTDLSLDLSGWNGVTAICAREDLCAGLREDGTVLLAGKTEGLESVSEWKQVFQVVLGENYAAGLLSNGTVVIANRGSISQNSVADWTEIQVLAAADGTLFGRKADGSILRTISTCGNVSREEFHGYSRVVSGEGYFLGLKEDGTVDSWGTQAPAFDLSETESWSGIQALAASPEGAIGLRTDGTATVAGDTFAQAKDWSGIQNIAAADGMAICLRTDGTLALAGEIPEELRGELEPLTGIRDISMGTDGTVALLGSENKVFLFQNGRKRELSADGNVTSLAAGDGYAATVLNDGTVSIQGSNTLSGVQSWQNISSVAAGVRHLAGLRADGTAAATGSNESGQCDIQDWTNLKDISAGEFCTIGLQEDGTVLIAGALPGEFTIRQSAG